LGSGTNWIDEVLQNPVSQNHNIALFGGNYKTNFTASLNYRGWEGIMLKTGQQRVSIRADLNHEMFDGKVKTNIQVINTSTRSEQGGAGGWAWRQAMIRNPTDAIQNADGSWKESNAYMYDNPLGIIHETINDNKSKEVRFSGSVDYRPIKDLSFKILASRVQSDNIYGNSTTFRHVNTTKNNLNGTANRSTGAGIENLMELTTNYMKTFERHRVTLLGGYSWQDYTGESFNVYNFDFPYRRLFV
ncbi:MAG: SusC/RagA family TonB-linked outer membrane protein, partial [Leadbetterella sp.]|nr:SusC/RagA family TonB-linked outer membrane protein [Leadbetterella sp.]